MSRKAMFLSWGLLALSACSKTTTEGTAVPTSAAAPAATPAARTTQDFKTPILTNDKISRFLESTREAESPLYLVSEEGGMAVDIARVKERMGELDAFARKYGFADYRDYASVWGRILTAESIMMSEEMHSGTSVALEQIIVNTEKQLKDPALSADMRKLYEEQLAGAKNSLEQLRKKTKDIPLNAADFELIKSRRDEIGEAVRKLKTKNE